MNQEIYDFNKNIFSLACSYTTDCCYPYELKPTEVTDTNNVDDRLKQVALFHFGIWLRGQDNVKFSFLTKLNDIFAVKQMSGLPLWILFHNKVDRTRFDKWIKKESIDNYFPPIPDGNNKLTIINTKAGFKYNSDFYGFEMVDGFLEQWLWIKANCKKKVFVSTNFLAFKDNTDATLYKLRWC